MPFVIYVLYFNNPLLEKNQYCSAFHIFLYLLNSDFHEGRDYVYPVHHRTFISYYMKYKYNKLCKYDC